MTIDNVLEILEKHKLRIPSNVFYELKADIVNFEEPTTKNNLGVDCISRVDVLKLMQDNWHTHNGDWAMQESMDDIRALPSVTPIRPKGHWINTANPRMSDNIVCSECGYNSIADFKFCPNCGCRMVEPQESEGNT